MTSTKGISMTRLKAVAPLALTMTMTVMPAFAQTAGSSTLATVVGLLITALVVGIVEWAMLKMAISLIGGEHGFLAFIPGLIGCFILGQITTIAGWFTNGASTVLGG